MNGWQQCVLIVLGWCLVTTLAAAEINLGERLYRQGIDVDGHPLKAIVQSDIAVDGRQVPCASCHRNSGYGDAEGGNYVPPVTAEVLFNDYSPARAHLFRNLYQDVQSPSTRADVHGLQQRRAYDKASLTRALTKGISSDGVQMSAQMPRFELSNKDIDALQHYLATLSTDTPESLATSGVDSNAIHFATVFVPNTQLDESGYSEKKAAINAVFSAYIKRKNLNTYAAQKKPGYSLAYKSDFVYTQKQWELHEWVLSGPENTWLDQLITFYKQQPVFAVLGGMGGDWQIIHHFCESQSLPCLFPNTPLPVTEETGVYTVYLTKGIWGEAETAAQWLTQQNGIDQVIQVYREGGLGEQAAHFLESRLAEIDLTVSVLKLPAEQVLDNSTWQSTLTDTAEQAVIFWLNQQDLKKLPELKYAKTLASASLADLRNHDLHNQPYPQKIEWVWPWAKPGQEPKRLYRARAWMRSRNVSLTHELEQLNSFFALNIADDALHDLLDRYSRDYFIETIERLTENTLNPGLYRTMSLGPGQRFAVMRNTIISLHNSSD